MTKKPGKADGTKELAELTELAELRPARRSTRRGARSEESPESEAIAGEASANLPDDLPSSGLLSFYDRLRIRIHDAVARRSESFGEPMAQALLLVPDVFILLVRLALDRRVPRNTRALFASAIAYYVLPFDVFPEGVIGPAGFLDDIVLGLVILSHSFDAEIEALAEEHWSGSGRLREVLADVVASGRSLLGADLSARLDRVLARRGVVVDD